MTLPAITLGILVPAAIVFYLAIAFPDSIRNLFINKPKPGQLWKERPHNPFESRECVVVVAVEDGWIKFKQTSPPRIYDSPFRAVMDGCAVLRLRDFYNRYEPNIK